MRVFIHPPTSTVVGAFLAASFAASAPALIIIYAFPMLLLVGAAHAFVLGVPLYYLLRRYVPIGWGASILAGALIGAAPIGLFMLWRQLGGSPDTDNPHSVAAMAHYFAAGGTVLGAIGGLAFRAVLGAPQIETEIDPRIFE